MEQNSFIDEIFIKMESPYKNRYPKEKYKENDPLYVDLNALAELIINYSPKRREKAFNLAGKLDESIMHHYKPYFRNALMRKFGFKGHFNYTPTFVNVLDVFIFFHEIGLEARELVKKWPGAFTCNKKRLIKTLDYLKTIENIDLNKIAHKRPIVFNADPQKIREIISFLNNAGIKRPMRIINGWPGILIYSTKKLRGNVSYLKKIGIKDARLVLNRFPNLLWTKQETMQKRVDYLEKLGIDDVGRFIQRAPSLLCYSEEKLQEKVDCLGKIGIKNLRKAIMKSHMLLQLSMANMKRKVDYITKKMGYSIDDIEYYPNVLSYSLENRIIPRWRFFKASKRRRKYLSNIFFPGDKFFATKIAGSSLEEYLKFKEKCASA